MIDSVEMTKHGKYLVKSPYIAVEKVSPLFSQISKNPSDQRSYGRALFPALLQVFMLLCKFYGDSK